MNWLMTYIAVAGSAVAGAQVARGAVRGVRRLAQGDPRGAVTQFAGGLLAPARSACHEVLRLGAEALAAAAAIAGGDALAEPEPDTPRYRPEGAECDGLVV
jgi:hypothetical protein